MSVSPGIGSQASGSKWQLEGAEGEGRARCWMDDDDEEEEEERQQQLRQHKRRSQDWCSWGGLDWREMQGRN